MTKHNSGYKGDDSRAQGYDNTRDRKIATLCCGYKADIGIRRLAAQMGADARRAGGSTAAAPRVGRGPTINLLRAERGFTDGELDFAFFDHGKSAYLPDLKRIVNENWLHRGSVVVADNAKFPVAPQYWAHLRQQEGRGWRTRDHKAHVEYQSLITDVVLESEYLGG